MQRSTLAPRSTTYCGIRMRSRLEASLAAILSDADLEWDYEPECFASEDGQYLPDFAVRSRGGPVYVEVKGPPIEDPGPIQRRMEIIWASEPSTRLFLVDSTGEWWFGSDGTWTGHS